MDNKQLAKQILQFVGGRENVSGVTHCITRLRIIVNDTKLIQEEEIKKLKVIGTNLVGTQFQVIIGPKVGDIFKEFEALVGKSQTAESGAPKKKLVNQVVDTFTGIFVPILPAIIGAGLLKGVLIFLMFFGLAPTDSDLYQLLSIFSDAAYYFLPMLLAVSTATHFKCNKFVAMAIAGVLLHPNLAAMMGGDAAIHLLGITVTKASYSSTVLPIILSIWLMSYVEKGLGKIVPGMLRTILVPLLTVLIVAPITLIAIGPLGTIVSNVLAGNFLEFYMRYGAIAGAIFAGFLPLMVLLGIHNGFTPVMVQSLATYGFEYLMGLNVASNSAQAGATFAVFMKTKNREFKSLAGTAALNAVIGITEPALYGITTKLKRPLIAVMIGGAVGGGIAGFFGVKATGMGTGPIAGIPLFLTDTFLFFVISCVVSFILAFVLTIVLGFEDVPEEDGNEVAGKDVQADNQIPAEHFSNQVIACPLEGRIIKLEDVADTVFSSKMIGDGIAILPVSGKVYAPFDGEIVSTVDSRHAVGIRSKDGCEVLIHVGLNTVELQGKGFTCQVKMGDQVHKGDLLLTFDIDTLKNAGYDLTTPVLIANTAQYARIETVKGDTVMPGNILLKATV